jgi:hypothetical protein
LEVTHFFALELKKVYENRTAGDFTFVGLLWEFNMNMAKV